MAWGTVSVGKWPGRFSLGSGPASDKLQAPWSKPRHGTDCKAVRALVTEGRPVLWTHKAQPPTQLGLHCQLNPPAQVLWGPGPGVIRWSGKAEAEAGHTLMPQDEREEARYPPDGPFSRPSSFRAWRLGRMRFPEESDFWVKGASNSCPLLSSRPLDPQEKGNNEPICYSLLNSFSCWLAGDLGLMTFYVSCWK